MGRPWRTIPDLRVHRFRSGMHRANCRTHPACRVVSDFRARDLAVGGEGAPLAPFFHHAVLGSERENRLILNLGGIANLTWLPRRAAPEEAVAFDVGPANVLIDEVVRIY